METDIMDTDHTAEIRDAVASGDWAAVLELWSAYADGIRLEIEQRRCTTERMAEAREFLAWAARVALCERAQTQARLDALHAANLYEDTKSQTPSTLRTSL